MALNRRFHGAPGPWMSAREARRAVYGMGLRAFTDRAKLAWAAGKPSAGPQWRGLLGQAETWSPPPMPVTGADVAAAGVPKGPLVGEVLREVESWWIDHDFMDDRDQALARLKVVARGLMG